MLLLVVSGLLAPGSKGKAYQDRHRYFERFNFSVTDLYRALSHFAAIAKDCQRHIHEHVVQKYGSNVKTIYYGVTNFYFEIDQAVELRKYGRLKEHRHNPLVQMGLAMDADGVPLCYEIFPGNKLDKETFRSVIGGVRKNYDTGRIVVVADMEVITGDNIYYLTGGKNRNGLVANLQQYSRTTSYGEAKYVKNLVFDKKTGEILNAKAEPCFDYEKLEQEQLYDGYYAIVTSELEMSEQQIIDTYRGLWEIEETFKITEGALEARPVFLSREERISAHFLSCFIALVIIWLIQKLTYRRYSAEKIVEALSKIACSNEQDNLYLFDYRSEISDAIGKALGIDFTRRRMQLGEVKNILAKAKK